MPDQADGLRRLVRSRDGGGGPAPGRGDPAGPPTGAVADDPPRGDPPPAAGPFGLLAALATRWGRRARGREAAGRGRADCSA